MKRGELARLAGCNPETVRYYEGIKLLPNPGRSPAGYRQYDQWHVERLKFIISGRQLGFKIADIKALLDLVDRQAVTCSEVKSTAEANLEAIRARITDLRRMETVLVDTIKRCSGDTVPDCPLIEAMLEQAR